MREPHHIAHDRLPTPQRRPATLCPEGGATSRENLTGLHPIDRWHSALGYRVVALRRGWSCMELCRAGGWRQIGAGQDPGPKKQTHNLLRSATSPASPIHSRPSKISAISLRACDQNTALPRGAPSRRGSMARTPRLVGSWPRSRRRSCAGWLDSSSRGTTTRGQRAVTRCGFGLRVGYLNPKCGDARRRSTKSSELPSCQLMQFGWDPQLLGALDRRRMEERPITSSRGGVESRHRRTMGMDVLNAETPNLGSFLSLARETRASASERLTLSLAEATKAAVARGPRETFFVTAGRS
jgi:hypothetical protein